MNNLDTQTLERIEELTTYFKEIGFKDASLENTIMLAVSDMHRNFTNNVSGFGEKEKARPAATEHAQKKTIDLNSIKQKMEKIKQ